NPTRHSVLALALALAYPKGRRSCRRYWYSAPSLWYPAQRLPRTRPGGTWRRESPGPRGGRADTEPCYAANDRQDLGKKKGLSLGCVRGTENRCPQTRDRPAAAPARDLLPCQPPRPG